MTLVAGVDSSTQSCKVVIRDAATGQLVREGRASHPEGTEVHPEEWWRALESAIEQAGGFDDVSAVSVAGQQHGMVVLDEDGQVVRPALLWNDTRSGQAASDLISELGAQTWADAVGTVPVASITATKLRWLTENEPENAVRVAAVALPHDWLTWRLAGYGGPEVRGGLDALATDRSDASGTGYWSPAEEAYRFDLLEHAFGRRLTVPRIIAPSGNSGVVSETFGGRAILGAGAGDNAGGAFGLGARPGDVIVSVGTSGTVFAVTPTPAADASGTVAGFADASGVYLPLIATLNASRIMDATARILGVDHAGLADLALGVEPGADGLALVPYFEGERTPNKPDASGSLHGMRLANSTPGHLARAAYEGVLCGLADGMDALISQGVSVERVYLIGGGAQSPALQQIAPTIFGRPVIVPPPGEYVADGAARQAAWALAQAELDGGSGGGGSESGAVGDGSRVAAIPDWKREGVEVVEAPAAPHVRERYAEVREMTAPQISPTNT